MARALNENWSGRNQCGWLSLCARFNQGTEFCCHFSAVFRFGPPLLYVLLKAVSEIFEFLELRLRFAQSRLRYSQNTLASCFAFSAQIQDPLNFLKGKSE